MTLLRLTAPSYGSPEQKPGVDAATALELRARTATGMVRFGCRCTDLSDLWLRAQSVLQVGGGPRSSADVGWRSVESVMGPK